MAGNEYGYRFDLPVEEVDLGPKARRMLGDPRYLPMGDLTETFLSYALQGDALSTAEGLNGRD